MESGVANLSDKAFAQEPGLSVMSGQTYFGRFDDDRKDEGLTEVKPNLNAPDQLFEISENLMYTFSFSLIGRLEKTTALQ